MFCTNIIYDFPLGRENWAGYLITYVDEDIALSDIEILDNTLDDEDMADSTDTFVTLKKVSSLLEKCYKFSFQPMISTFSENSRIQFNVTFIGFFFFKKC